MEKLSQLIIFAVICLCINQIHAQRKVSDITGTQVVLPDKIERIADSWPAHNAIVTMLGYGDKIVATVVSERMCPWLYKINPAMKNAVLAFSPNATGSVEELVKVRPDIVFLTALHANAEAIKRAGMTPFSLSLSDFPTLRSCVLMTAEALGGEAKEKAEKYAVYLDDITEKIGRKTESVPSNERPRVLHLSNINPFSADGKGSMMDSWIKLAGGVNVVGEVTGANRQVSAEQLIIWDPDIIIVGNTSNDITETAITNNPVLKNIKAVKDKKVYINPKGMFFWDRYSAEAILQLQWAAKIFYPEKFKEIDITSETVDFYKTFFDYPLSNEEAEMIIKGIPPKK
ncbi:MAG: ABC transporter substrate-binding protein [Tannerella sp.]|jgi:iron complex transport system substrate-binding protein|nr:ABC transporter substrate-binding protein [Tannerella sp.]